MKKESPKLLLPIHNIQFSSDRRKTLKVENALLITPENLIKRWRSIGLPGTFKGFKKDNIPEWPHVFEGSHVILIQEITPQEFSSQNFFRCFNYANKILYVLQSSLLARSTIYNRDIPGNPIASQSKFDSHYSFYGTKKHYGIIRVGVARSFHLDDHVLDDRHYHFFNKVLPLFNSKFKIDPSWEKDLKQSVILAGKAVEVKEHWETFSWCFIAIERLLKEKGAERFKDQAGQKLKALFGEFSHYNSGKWESLIDDIYRKRNLLVHQGEYEEIRLEDTVIAESLLSNLLDLILKNLRIFKSREHLIKFVQKYQARKILGQPFERYGDFSYSIPNLEDSRDRIVKMRRWF